MRCPACGHNNKGKFVTEGSNCAAPRCDYRFVFTIEDDPRMTDGLFLFVARKASGNGTRWFTLDEMWAVYTRILYTKTPSRSLLMSLAGVLVALAILLPLARLESTTWFSWFAMAASAVGVLWYLTGLPRSRFEAPSRAALAEYVHRWTAADRSIEKLITHPGLHDAPPEWPEGDIYDYGAQQILIVERDILVDWLVLNGWHTQNSTLVIAESGYPGYITERASKLIAEREDLPIFLLHDSSRHGARMSTRIEDSGTPLCIRERNVVDLGLTAQDADRLDRRGIHGVAQDQFRLTVDALGFRALAPGLTTATVGGLAISELIADPRDWPSAAADHSATVGFG